MLVKSSEKQRLRSLGPKLTPLERIVLLHMNDLVDVRLNSTETIREIYTDIFGEQVKNEEISEIMQDFLF